MSEPVNLNEQIVKEMIEEQIKDNPEFCPCEQCKADALGYALNKLPPQYVVSEKGKIITRANILDTQKRTDLLVVVRRALLHVQEMPRHNK